MNKMQILMILGAGTLSFAGSFGVSWFLKSKEATDPAEAILGPETAQAAANSDTQAEEAMTELFSDTQANPVTGMSEKQLQHLIHEIRSKMKEYQHKEVELKQKAERVEMARHTLQKDIDRLNLLREKISTSMQALNQKEQALNKTLVVVEDLEKKNFQRLAGMYDKMDSIQAGKVLATMAGGPQITDAVKILYYMNERASASILSEIAGTRPELSALLSLQLKRVQEKD